MSIPPELIFANGVTLVVLLFVLFLGWHEAAAFGLATLVILNLLVALRGRQARGAAAQHEPEGPPEDTEGETRE